MKNLKYIKLFEAFDARTLNATLKHVKSKTDKTNFLNTLKSICRRFDIPESKLTDDLFTYLPFNKALRFNNVVVEDQPCDAEGEFVAGEKCDNGKVRRPWGRGFRIVDCGTCQGTGIKPKKSNLSMLKFWFDADGKFITTTAVDGVYRETTAANTVAFSPNIEDYEVVKRIPKTQIKNQLETGDIIAVDFLDNHWNGQVYNVETQIVAYVFKENQYGNIKLFAIQNRRGRWPRPNDYNAWRQIASESWTLTSSKCNNINLLKPKVGTAGLDPYGYNTTFDLGNFRIRPLQINSTVRDANFAIIMDFSKLEKFETEKKTEIETRRKESRQGALALVSNDDIKNANIKRYFDKIATTFKITGQLEDVTKFNKMTARLVSRNSSYLLNQSASDTISNGLSNVAGYMFKVIKKIKVAEREDTKSIENGTVPTATENLKNERDFKDNIQYLNDKYSSVLDWSINSNEQINKSLRLLRKKITETNDEFSERDLKVLENIDTLSLEIQRYISSIEVNTLDDVEFLQQEILSIRQLFRSERTGVSSLNNFFDRMRPGSYYNSTSHLYASLTERRNYYGNINNGIRIMINIIRKKQGQTTLAETNEASKNIR